MVKEYFTLKMVIDLLASMIMTSSMEKVFTILRAEVGMKANGKKVNIMARVLYFAAMVM